MLKFKEYDYKKYDFVFLLVVIIIVSVGCFLISKVQLPGENLLKKQIIGLVGGVFIAIIVSLIDYHFISKFYIILYIINLGLLIMVKKFGVDFNGAKRWVKIKGIQFQPSELSKIILIIFLAKIFVMLGKNLNKFYFLALSIILMGIPTYLILTQTDLSTSMVLMFIFAMMIFAAGLSYKIIIPILVLGVPIIGALFWYIQQDYQMLLDKYQQKRVLALLKPELYPEIMWQQENSIQAIGSGGLFGKFISGSENTIRGYSYVPISESDFIFSVAGEELGFIGSTIVILLFTLLIFLCLLTSKQASDDMGKYISIGIASMFMFQVFVNIGVATSLLPNTGIPLPFLSYGLSSLLSSMIAIGMIINIRLQRK